MLGTSRWGQRIPLDALFRRLLDPNTLLVEEDFSGPDLSSIAGPGDPTVQGGQSVAANWPLTPRDYSVTARSLIDLPDPAPEASIGEVSVELLIRRGSGRSVVSDRLRVPALGRVAHVAAGAPNFDVRVRAVRLFPITEAALPTNPMIHVDVTPGSPYPWVSTRDIEPEGAGVFSQEIDPYAERVSWAASINGVPVPYRCIFLSSRGFEVGAAQDSVISATSYIPRPSVPIPQFATSVTFVPLAADAGRVVLHMEGQR